MQLIYYIYKGCHTHSLTQVTLLAHKECEAQGPFPSYSCCALRWLAPLEALATNNLCTEYTDHTSTVKQSLLPVSGSIQILALDQNF